MRTVCRDSTDSPMGKYLFAVDAMSAWYISIEWSINGSLRFRVSITENMIFSFTHYNKCIPDRLDILQCVLWVILHKKNKKKQMKTTWQLKFLILRLHIIMDVMCIAVCHYW